MDNFLKILKLILVILVLLLLGWLAVTSRFNIGRLIERLLGRKQNRIRPIISDGKKVGESVPIVRDHNPFRDKGVIRLENGDELELPEGIIDSDIESVIKVKPGVYNVKNKHDILTSVFDVDHSA